MTAAEKTEKVQRILELIDGVTRHAIQLRAYFLRGAHLGKHDSEELNTSKAADGYNIVMNSLYFELVIVLACLFDPSEARKAENTASLPVLIDMLKDQDVQAELKRRSIARKHEGLDKLPQHWREEMRVVGIKAAEARAQDILTVIGDYNSLNGCHLVDHIRTARNKYYAHIAITPSKPNKLAYGEAEELLSKTIPFLIRLQLSARDLHTTYDENDPHWENFADVFWGALMSGVKDGPTSPSTATNQPRRLG